MSRRKEFALLPGQAEIAPNRFQEVRNLTVSGLIYENILTEDLRDQIAIDNLQSTLALAIESEVALLVTNEALRDRVVTGIKNSVQKSDLTSGDYKHAKQTLTDLSEQNRELRLMGLGHLHTAIENREEDAIQNETQQKIAKKRKRVGRIKKALIATDALLFLGVPTVAAGTALPIYEAVQQTHLPAYADTDGRTQIVDELRTARADLTVVPAGLRKIQDKNNNTVYVPRPAILPRSDKAWYLVSRAGRDLNGAGPVYEGPVLTVQNQLFSPSHQAIDSIFSGQRQMLGSVIQAVPSLANSHAARVHDQEWNREKEGIILGGTSFVITLLDFTQNMRWRNRRKRINGQINALERR